MLLAGWLKTNICSAPGYELYNTKICLPNGLAGSVHLCQISSAGMILNHIVSMLRCETDECKNFFLNLFIDCGCFSSLLFSILQFENDLSHL